MGWFGKKFFRRLVLAWLEDYLDRQIGQLLVYLRNRGWVREDGIHVPARDLAAFARDFLKGIAHVLRHG